MSTYPRRHPRRGSKSDPGHSNENGVSNKVGDHLLASNAPRALRNTKKGKRKSNGLERHLLCPLRFVSKTEPWFLEKHGWTDEQVSVRLSSTMPELEELVREQIVERLQNDRALLAKTRHREVKTVIHFDLEVSVRAAGHRTRVSTPVAQHMFATVADFFWDPLADDAGLYLDVHLSWDGRQSEHAIWNLGREPEPDELVLPTVQQPVPRQYFRAHPRKARKEGGDDTVPSSNVLVGYYDFINGRRPEAQHLRCHRVKTWDFGDYLIGDPSEGEVFPPMKDASIREELHRLALREMDAVNAGTGQPVPFMPTYNFNRYDPAQYGFDGVRKAKIDAVVRFVGHFNVGYEPKQGDDPEADAWLPRNLQIEFEAFEGEQAIISHLIGVLRERAVQSDLGEAQQAAIDSLFLKRGGSLAVDAWKLLLFVLPQVGKKLHRFPSNGPGTVEWLWQYVDPKKIRTDRDGLERSSLYMEAHIVEDSREAGVVVDKVARK